jgi:hypothetical protein
MARWTVALGEGRVSTGSDRLVFLHRHGERRAKPGKERQEQIEEGSHRSDDRENEFVRLANSGVESQFGMLGTCLGRFVPNRKGRPRRGIDPTLNFIPASTRGMRMDIPLP